MSNDGLTLNQLAERNAVLVTEVEKLRAERDQLAAENVAMKSNAIKARRVIMSSKFDYWSDRVELFEVVRLIIETPATDHFVAGIKADGVEQAANECYGAGYICETLLAYAQQLREGAE